MRCVDVLSVWAVYTFKLETPGRRLELRPEEQRDRREPGAGDACGEDDPGATCAPIATARSATRRSATPWIRVHANTGSPRRRPPPRGRRSRSGRADAEERAAPLVERGPRPDRRRSNAPARPQRSPRVPRRARRRDRSGAPPPRRAAPGERPPRSRRGAGTGAGELRSARSRTPSAAGCAASSSSRSSVTPRSRATSASAAAYGPGRVVASCCFTPPIIRAVRRRLRLSSGGR